MQWQASPLVPVLLALAALSLALAFAAFRRRNSPGARAIALLALAAAIWQASYALELAGIDYEVKVLWAKFQYFGIATAPTVWLVLALQYTSRGSWLTRRALALLAISPLATLVLVWTNEGHGLIWSGISLDTSGPLLVLEHGLAFWAFAGYSYLLVLGGLLLLAEPLLRSSRLVSGQTIALIISLVAPWVSNWMFAVGLRPIPLVNLTPFAFGVSVIALGWALARFRLLDIAPVARDAAFDGTSHGVLVLDALGRVIDYNAMLQSVIGKPIGLTIGHPLLEAWPEGHDLLERNWDAAMVYSHFSLGGGEEEHTYDVTVTPLYGGNHRLTGRVVMFHDITHRTQAEEQARESEEQFRLMSEVEAIAINQDGAIVAANQMMSEMFGYSISELVGKDALDLAAPWSRNTVQRAIQKQPEQSYEAVALRKDGSTFIAGVHGKTIPYPKSTEGMTMQQRNGR